MGADGLTSKSWKRSNSHMTISSNTFMTIHIAGVYGMPHSNAVRLYESKLTD